MKSKCQKGIVNASQGLVPVFVDDVDAGTPSRQPGPGALAAPSLHRGQRVAPSCGERVASRRASNWSSIERNIRSQRSLKGIRMKSKLSKRIGQRQARGGAGIRRRRRRRYIKVRLEAERHRGGGALSMTITVGSQ